MFATVVVHAAAAAAVVVVASAVPARANAATISAPAVGPILFVPLDDRPVTYRLPLALGAIAGQAVLAPPRATIGRYLQPGDGDAILRWLGSPETAGASALVASTDMIVYGGLVASRLPGVPASDGYVRLRALAALKAARDLPFVAVFGTIMRLAPTGVPRLGDARAYYATGDTVDEIAAYANLPDPPATPQERGKAARLRAKIGDATLAAYLAARARDRDVDEWALQMTAAGGFDRIVLGQDDAGPVGLHLEDVAALARTVRRDGIGDRASIEPGADELGMALLARALARNVGWTPTVRVAYSRPDGGALEDRLEYAPIDATIAHLIDTCGARRVEARADVTLYVRVAGTTAANEATFEDALASDVRAGGRATVADLTFLDGTPGPSQRELTEALIARGIAGDLDGFASWNTDANTVGTSLAVAIATGAGRRAGRYDPRAHAAFMLDRYADDYAFHQFVRPALNTDLHGRDVDTTLLTPGVARETGDRNRSALWPYALDLLARIFPAYRDAGLTITLPWNRTFETELDVRLGQRSGG